MRVAPNFRKNKDTWCKALGYIQIPDKIQPGEYSKGSGTDDALCIRNSDGDLNVFNVEHNDDGLWLNSNYGNPDNVWNADNQWVFVRPRNSLCFSSPACAGLVSISNF